MYLTAHQNLTLSLSSYKPYTTLQEHIVIRTETYLSVRSYPYAKPLLDLYIIISNRPKPYLYPIGHRHIFTLNSQYSSLDLYCVLPYPTHTKPWTDCLPTCFYLIPIISNYKCDKVLINKLLFLIMKKVILSALL